MFLIMTARFVTFRCLLNELKKIEQSHLMVGLGSIVRVKCEDRDKTILLLFSVLILRFLLQGGNRFNS